MKSHNLKDQGVTKRREVTHGWLVTAHAVTPWRPSGPKFGIRRKLSQDSDVAPAKRRAHNFQPHWHIAEPHNVYYVELEIGSAPRRPRFAEVPAAATVRPPQVRHASTMAPLVRFDAVSVTFGEQQVLIDADFAIEPGERVCLIGRNGAGKSTTLKLITGTQEPDAGSVEKPARLRFSLLEQKLADESPEVVREFVAHGMARQLARIAEFEQLTAGAPDRQQLREIEGLEREIEAGGGWNVDVRIQMIISELGLPGDERMSALSGGWRRRAALAQALVSNPELLLLDEPTNHLDISTIEWLEKAVRNYPGAVLFVTHDRSFVEKVATRIVDIDRGKLRSWPGGYKDYLAQRAKSDEEEDRQNALFDKKLAEEEIWVRKGVKARQTRNEGRVRALEELRDVRAARIKRPRAARVQSTSRARSRDAR